LNKQLSPVDKPHGYSTVSIVFRSAPVRIQPSFFIESIFFSVFKSTKHCNYYEDFWWKTRL